MSAYACIMLRALAVTMCRVTNSLAYRLVALHLLSYSTQITAVLMGTADCLQDILQTS